MYIVYSASQRDLDAGASGRAILRDSLHFAAEQCGELNVRGQMKNTFYAYSSGCTYLFDNNRPVMPRKAQKRFRKVRIKTIVRGSRKVRAAAE